MTDHICLSCGMCCTGTLFERTLLKDEEVSSVAQLGFAILRHGAQPCFAQPCPRHRERGCTIYADRPHSCRGYRCATLKALENGSISETEARRRVGEAVRASGLVKECLGPDTNLAARRNLWQEGRGPVSAGEGRARLAMVALSRLVDRYFTT